MGVSAEMFKPQGNLKPKFLNKEANHLEVRNFSQSVEVYIVTGFKDTPPQKVWPYIKPLMHNTWSNALELNNVKEKWLKETLEMLIEFENLTADTLATHIFLQESDATMTKMAYEILYDT